MLCYRCGTHAPDTAQACPNCGQKLSGAGLRQATGTFSRRRATAGTIEGAPFKAQDLVASRYLIKEVVGGGPLGFVFRAQDKEIDVEVALKVINPKLVQTPDERKQFAKQLRLARKLSHPNLVRVYEEGEDQDRPYFTSQFLDGLTLRKIIELRLQKGQFFTLAEIEPILSQICAALDGAHKLGPHSDLKPENVLVLPDLLKVTDFGLGLAMPRLPFVQAMKARKLDRYLSPELVEGGEIDLRADLYSAGVILGEMLSGQTPDGAIPELGKRNADIPAAVEGFYRKCINANPLARFKTAGELMAEFSELVKKHGGAQPGAAPDAPNVGGGQAPRPRSPTGMLQLQPRRPGPPVPAAAVPVGMAPPPPPPVTGETVLPDATQPLDPSQLRSALEAPMSAQDAKDNREPTAVLDSGQLLGNPDDEETKVGVETTPGLSTVAPPAPAPAPVVPPPSALRPAPASSGSTTWIYVTALVILGVGLGAGGGYYWLQKQRAATRPEVTDAERAAIDREVSERLARAEREAAEKIAAEKAAAEKLAAEKAAIDKAAADKAAAEKAAAEKVTADKAAAEKAAAEKAAAEKAAADKAAAEKPAGEKPPVVERPIGKTPEKPAVVVAEPPPTPAAAAGGCPDGMRSVAAGAFRMGTPKDDPMAGFEDKALAAVTVGAYCIDTFEYPNKRGVTPTVSVTFADAERMCTSAGKRLCTEAEWEKACKGAGSAKWGYSNTFDANACNTEDDTGEARSLTSAGRFARCRSSYGTQDMSGNVAEWTAERVVKGGSYATSDYGVRCAARKTSGVTKSSEVGFRCCADLH